MSTASNCPDASILTRFAHGQLDDPHLQMVSLHVAECESCQQKLDLIDPSRLEASLRASFLKDDASASNPPPSFIQRTMEILQQERILSNANWGEHRLDLRETVSRNGMLARHSATERSTGQRCFAVLARVESVSSKEHRAQFFSDIQLAMQITHPNCEAICDFGMWDQASAYYLAYWFDGTPLRVALQKRVFGFAKVLSILEQCVLGLTAAHRLGIAHRHVNTNSVFLTSAGQVILVEFGLLYDERYQGDLLAPSSLQSKALAPEVRQGRQKQVDSRCDVYGLGRVAGALFKRLDLESGTGNEVSGAHPSEFARSRVKQLIQASQSNSRRKRPETPGLFWDQLMNCLH